MVTHSMTKPSIPRKLFDFYFPVVTVELVNNATHDVHVKCGVEKFNKRLLTIGKGEAISWQFREILFPLKCCYVHVDDDNQGVFWASDVRLQCTHCQWSLREDGVYFYIKKLQKWVKRPAVSGSISECRCLRLS